MKKNFRKKVSQCRKKTEREEPSGVFYIHFVAKHQKIEGRKNFYFRKKISQCQKKTERGTLWHFPISILSQNSKKIEGGHFGGKFFSGKKVSQCRKKTERTLWSRPVWYVTREKQEKLFWFSSLGQMVHFGAIIFCRTFVELFWSVEVVLKNTDEKP